jgi:peptide/nickel transport system permease protein
LSRLIYGARVSLYVGVLAVSIALILGATSGIIARFTTARVGPRAIGVPNWKIMLRHVLPNVSAPLIVQTTVSLSTAILTEAALSFLGLGTQPPTASWGLMLSAARLYMLIDPWIAILPGVAIALTVLGFNLLGDGLRDVLDPRIRTM